LEIISTQPGIVTVENPEPITGGASAVATVPSTEDRYFLRNKVLQAAKAAAILKIETDLTSEYILIPESIGIKQIVNETYFPAANVAGDHLSLEMDVTYQAVIVSKEFLGKYIDTIIRNTIPDGAGAEVLSSKIIDVVTLMVNSDNSLELNLITDIVRTTTIDKNQVKNLIRWKSINQAEDLILRLNEVESAKIIPTPNWWLWIPFTEFRVIVEQD